MGPITNALAMEAAAMVFVAALFASNAGLFVLGTLLGTSADTPLHRSARETIAVDSFAMVERCCLIDDCLVDDASYKRSRSYYLSEGGGRARTLFSDIKANQSSNGQ
jgi:hypothetical protein